MTRHIFPFLLLAGLIACQTETLQEKQAESAPETTAVTPSENDDSVMVAEEPNKEHNWLMYEGTVGIYESHVVAYLTYDDQNKVTGTYYYTKHQKPISLNGSYDPSTGKYTLTESYKGKATGIMILTNKNGNLSGEWKISAKANEAQEMNLRFLEQKVMKEPTLNFEKYENTHDIAIFFNGNDDEYETVTDALRISILSPNYRAFDYDVTGANAHTGAASGLIEMEDDHTGYFRGEDDCVLTFHFKKSSVSIEENNCIYYHGARAYMDNELEKVK